MTTAINIEVILDEKGVVQGVQKITSGLDAAGKRGSQVFDRMSKDQMKARETAMMLSQTFGVQIPGGLQKVLTKLPGLSTALRATFSAALVAGLIVGIASAIDNIDVLKKKLLDVGLTLVEAYERTNNWLFGGKESEIAMNKAARVAQKAVQGMTDSVQQMRDQAALVGKEGLTAIEIQAQQMYEKLVLAQERMLHDAAAQYGGRSPTFAAILTESQRVMADAKAEIEHLSNVKSAQLRKEDLEDLKQRQNEAVAANLTGLQKMLADEQENFRKIQVERAKHESGWAEGANAAASKQTTNQIEKQAQEYRDEIDKLIADTHNKSVSGLSQIAMEAAAKIDEIRKNFTKRWGDDFSVPDPNEPEAQKRFSAWVNAYALMNQGIDAVNQEAAIKRQQELGPTMAETAAGHERAQAAAAPPWLQGSAEAMAQYHDQLRQIDQWEQEHLARLQKDSEEYVFYEEQAQQRRADAWTETNARIIQENRQMRDELAGELESVFDDITSGNIGQRILSEIKKFFFKIVASWIMSMGQMKGASAGGLGGGGLFDSLLGGLFGSKGGNNTSLGTPPFFPTGNSLAAGTALLSSSSALPGIMNLPASAFAPTQLGSMTLSAGTGTSAAMQTQSAQTVLGGLMQAQLGKVFSHGLSIGKFKISGAQLGMLGMGVGLESILGAYSAGSPTAGAAGGALGGVMTGLSVGGPLGAVIGGVVGGIAGLISGIFGAAKRKRMAEEYVTNNVVPSITQIVDQYKNWQSDAYTAFDALEQLKQETEATLYQQFGQQGFDVAIASWTKFNQAKYTIDEIDKDRQHRSSLDLAPAQFAVGGTIPGMRGQAIPIVAHGGEEVIQAGPAQRNRGLLKAINSGQDLANQPIQVTVQVSTMDAKSFRQFALGEEIARSIRQAVRSDNLNYAVGGG